MNFDRDRQTEKNRYNQRAADVLTHDARDAIGLDGAASISLTLRTPYLRYESLIRSQVETGSLVLDLCCGNGLHSLTAALAGATVTASDIAENNLVLTAARAQRAGVTVQTVVAAAENVPLPDASFDVITCAGSLSYVDLTAFRRELRRLLRPGGAFVFVDSFNHNPIYRFNRWLHYVRGNRSLSTLQRMPTLDTLDALRIDFPDLSVSYHGVLSFLSPLLRLVGEARAARWLDGFDARFPFLARQAFKVVAIGHRPTGPGAPQDAQN